MAANLTERIAIKQSADPAAGAQISWTADENVIIRSVTFQLTTDANVATRGVILQARDAAGKTFFRTISQQTQAASVTQNYQGHEGLQHATPGSNWGLLPLPAGGLRLRTGDVLLTGLNNGQVGDDFTAITMQVEKADTAIDIE